MLETKQYCHRSISLPSHLPSLYFSSISPFSPQIIINCIIYARMWLVWKFQWWNIKKRPYFHETLTVLCINLLKDGIQTILNHIDLHSNHDDITYIPLQNDLSLLSFHFLKRKVATILVT